MTDRATGLKIAVYAISKNESQFVKRFCASAKDADAIFIADTGSTDDTVELAVKHGAIVHSICITPWRFDLARNAALALVPREYDICISLDLDEVMEPGWREEIERVWQPGITSTGSAWGTSYSTTGQVCWDASYVYVCTATNTWKRAAIATW